jgi:TPR repeat protein
MGDAQAMYDLGVAHLTTSGNGIIKPNAKREPVFWFRKAAEKGHPGAMYELAGLGGVSNEEKVMWLKKGAELGSKACMVELMNGYFHQQFGLPKDIGAFLFWEARVSEASMKESGTDSKTIETRLKEGEARRRREMNYDGPIRPVPPQNSMFQV